jgi:hypothetical protein
MAAPPTRPLKLSPRTAKRRGKAPEHAAPPTSRPAPAPQGLLSETRVPADLQTRDLPNSHRPEGRNPKGKNG